MGVSRRHWEMLASSIMQSPKVTDIIIYGSRSKGTYRIFSDIDITLKGAGLRHPDLFPILNRIDELNLPYEVDLSIYDDIDNQAMRDEIAHHGISLLLLLDRTPSI